MTNDENMSGTTNPIADSAVALRPFGLRHSFVIRHSSFVIPVFALALALASTSCNNSKRITKANVDEVADGMAKKQVESILGPPNTVDTKDFALLKKTIYIYNQGKDTVTIVFKDDKVQSKASTLSD